MDSLIYRRFKEKQQKFHSHTATITPLLCLTACWHVSFFSPCPFKRQKVVGVALAIRRASYSNNHGRLPKDPSRLTSMRSTTVMGRVISMERPVLLSVFLIVTSCFAQTHTRKKTRPNMNYTDGKITELARANKASRRTTLNRQYLGITHPAEFGL